MTWMTAEKKRRMDEGMDGWMDGWIDGYAEFGNEDGMTPLNGY